jgi:hypothetical protein
MNPKKLKDILGIVSEKTNLEVDVINKINNHFWTSVREKLSNLENLTVHVTNLGNFNFKEWDLDKSISFHEKWLKEDDNKENLLKYKAYEDRLERLNNLKKLQLEEYNRKINIRSNEYKNIDKSLEGKREDFSGYSQSDI